ncbi:MAG TPA: chemotaxis protein CheA [Solirubrobacteraceae bacterium]|nr:chemotaxis protein CheA [Solirubrobacteraceae bacterium]
MDTSEYMPMFLAEAEEHLQELNLAVVSLEEDPRNREKVDTIFRIAHSLKGMSATMGFEAIATLTHEMEDVFELLRQRERALSREAVDTVLACLDALSGAVSSIETAGSEELDPSALITRLRALVHARSPEQEIERQGGRVVPDLEALLADGIRVLYVKAALRETVLMPSVRAHMVLAALAEHGDLLGSAPTPEGVEQFDGYLIEAWLACEHEEEAIQTTVTGISDVMSAEILELIPGSETAVAHANAATVLPASRGGAGTPPVPAAEQSPAPAPTAQHTPASPAPAGGQPPAPVPAAGAAAAPEPRPGPPGRPASGGARTVRVDSERLDALMHSMGELVIHRTALEAIASRLEVSELHQAMQELTRSSQALQAMVMQVRMIPVDVVFLRFPRLVRDLSTKLGKTVRLELIGSETELDRTVVDALGDPLVHLVRNSLDHGLEPAAERLAAGKPEEGTLQIAARHAGGSVVIEVRDDGRGIDPAAVARKAAKAGLIDASAVADIDMAGAVELLFAPGFSTAEVTSDISGRGVGMDAVRAKIRELGGEVIVDSVLGQGTTAQIRLPLTLAIVSGLLVEISHGPYAIPLDRIERTLRLAEHPVQSVAGEQLLMLDDGVLPLLDASRVFGRQPRPHAFAVIVRSREQRIALAVDELIGQREFVTRPLPAAVSGGEPVSGGTALPDGRIALIVDCDALSLTGASRPSLTANVDLAAPASAAVAA